jgi:hypothetical protein
MIVRHAEPHEDSERENIQPEVFRKKTTGTHLEIINLRNELNELKKTHKYIIISTMFLCMLSSGLIFYIAEQTIEQNKSSLDKKFLIEPLKGNTIGITVPWHFEQNKIVNVNIVNADTVPSEKIAVIKDAILSKKVVSVDGSVLQQDSFDIGSVYYAGWQGALKKASEKPTKFLIPKNFNIIESPKGEGDIIIKLSPLKNDEGYLGDTKLEVDSGKVVKSVITIYDIGNLSNKDLSGIIRHEFGHALGLGHSTTSDDLMHDIINNQHVYISNCDIGAIDELYNGNESHQVICKT